MGRQWRAWTLTKKDLQRLSTEKGTKMAPGEGHRKWVPRGQGNDGHNWGGTELRSLEHHPARERTPEAYGLGMFLGHSVFNGVILEVRWQG